jgi:class 3 adenylate cyclase
VTGVGEGRSGTATVLFTDLVGSTSQRVEVGEDAADEFRRAGENLRRW